jgi:hypothetical protein
MDELKVTLEDAVKEIDACLYDCAETYEMGRDGHEKAWAMIKGALGMSDVECQARAENWGC